MMTRPLPQDDPRRPWLEDQANRIERIGLAHRLPVRVVGGMVTINRIHFQLAGIPSAIPLKHLVAVEEDMALALKVDLSDTLFYRDNGHLILEMPCPHQVNPISLVGYQASLPPLPLATALLGRTDDNEAVILALPACSGPVVITGSNGAGKTTLLRTILLSLILTTTDDSDLRLVLADYDEGRSFLQPFTAFPHTIGQVLADAGAIRQRLTWLVEELVWRQEQSVRCPRVVIVINTERSLATAPQGELAEEMAQLATAGPAYGFHLVLVGQVAAMPPAVVAAASVRLTGRCTSAAQALEATGIKGSGAERLLGQGSFVLTRGCDLVQFQAANTYDQDIQAVAERFAAEGSSPPRKSPTATAFTAFAAVPGPQSREAPPDYTYYWPGPGE